MRVCLSTYHRYFFDECVFRLNGSVSTQNVRIWGTERPAEGRQTFSYSPSTMLWCGISKEKDIGPYFFQDQNVNGENYRKMLIEYAFPRLASIRTDFIFHSDGAPAPYSSRVRTYLDNKRPGNWIGRGRTVERPPRSPNLTPCDFFLWGHLQEKVYATLVASMEGLKERIRRECRRIRPSVLKRVWNNVPLRLNILENNSGAHIEKLLC